MGAKRGDAWTRWWDRDGKMSDPGDTATRDEKYERGEGACRDRLREGGNTGQASEETSHKEKIIGSILHEEGSR